MISLAETNDTGHEGYRSPEAASWQDCFAVTRNQMEERNLRTRLGSIGLEEKRVLRRLHSETRLWKIKQEQRLGRLTFRRNGITGGQINNSGSSTPRSLGRPCQLDFMKLQFKSDKRPHSNSIDSLESPGGTNDGPSLLRSDEFAQSSPWLPNLPLVKSVKSAEPIKITELMSSTSKNNDPVLGNRKPSKTSMIPLRGENKSIAVPREKPSGTRLGRQTWYGQSPPELQTLQPLAQGKLSYPDNSSSLRNQATYSWDASVSITEDISHIQNDDRKAQDFPVNKFNGPSRMAYPVAEDLLPRNSLVVPYFPFGGLNLATSLRSFKSLPLVLEGWDIKSDKTGEEVFEEAEVVSVGLVESLQSSMLPSGAASILRQRCARTLRGQESLGEDDSSLSLPTSQTLDTTQSVREGEERSGVSGKLAHQVQSSQGLKSINLAKNTSLERKRLSVGSLSYSPTTGPSYKEDAGQKIPKKREKEKECAKSKLKEVLEKDTESKKEDVTPQIDKSNWLKALHKVFHVNMFLNGMTTFQDKQELNSLATEKKKAAFEQLYEELKHCRYLRMPSKEENEPSDCVSLVFHKN